MRILRRFLMLAFMGWWLGGLTLYTTAVLRYAHRVIANHTRVGFVTQAVTIELQWIGAAALALMLWDGLASWGPSGRRLRWARAASWGVAALAHVGLFILHLQLDAMLDFQARQVRDGMPFHGPHEAYEALVGIEWGAGLVYLLAALAAWRQMDSAGSAAR
jgi:hypothetical protein